MTTKLFREKVVRAAADMGAVKAADKYDVKITTLYYWIKQHRKENVENAPDENQSVDVEYLQAMVNHLVDANNKANDYIQVLLSRK